MKLIWESRLIKIGNQQDKEMIALKNHIGLYHN